MKWRLTHCPNNPINKNMQQRRYSHILAGILAVSGATLLQGSQPQIPNPQAAAQQAEKLTPEKLTQIEVDDDIRDRLRFDPAWKPIADSIRQDLAILKWGDGKLENPAWKRYGAKAYPLFDYYARSQDPIRQTYGMMGIRNLGKPYTTLWLTRHLQRRLTQPELYLVTNSLNNLLNNTYEPKADEQAWQKEFGLDDPAVRDRLIRLAKQNLEPETTRSYYEQFNGGFLLALFGEKAFPEPPTPAEPTINLSQWLKFERPTQPSSTQIKDAIAYYRNLKPEIQEQLLVKHLGGFKAGKIPPIGKALLLNLAADNSSGDQTWAIAELDRHGDPQGTQLLQMLLNKDLSKIYPLTSVTSYKSSSVRDEHAYNLLIGIAQKYPQSKFIRGCREYGDLIGASYFDHAPRSQAIINRNAKKTPTQQTQDWQQWLSRYPDHPGADDATYHLARSLQAQNDVMGATRLWMKLMTQQVGDGDAIYLAWSHMRSLLDVGLTTDQIETLLTEPNSASMVPLLKYTLSVRYARAQNYAKALEISTGLDITKMSDRVLGSYYNHGFYNYIVGGPSLGYSGKVATATVQKDTQTMLSEQRQRWQNLFKLQQENTPDSQYRLGSDWAGKGGWKNGYLAIWDGWRAWHLPLEECGVWWVCNMKLRDPSLVRSLYQSSSQNAVAVSLYQKLLDDPRTSSQIREKTLYQIAATLLWQWQSHPTGETLRIHPPAGVQGKPQNGFEDGESYNGDPDAALQMKQDYQRRINQILAELQLKYPHSNYIDDLLFSNYFMSGDAKYLQQIVDKYPHGDHIIDAKFLLAHRK
jgi:hypothetical protein